MKIIKYGTPPEKRIWRGTCYRCNSEVEATVGDFTGPINPGCQREPERSAHAPCPVCLKGQILFIETRETTQ